MKVYYFAEVVEFLEKIEESEKARVTRTREFFEKHGFKVGPKYIKKIKKNIWELRAGSIRVFLYIIGERAIGVHAIRKKSQKIPLKDIKLAEKRSQEV